MKLSELFQGTWPHCADYQHYLPAQEPDDLVVASHRAVTRNADGYVSERTVYALTPTSLVIAVVNGRLDDKRRFTGADINLRTYPLVHLSFVERKHVIDYHAEYGLVNKTHTDLTFHFAPASGIPEVTLTEPLDVPASQYQPFFATAMALPRPLPLSATQE